MSNVYSPTIRNNETWEIRITLLKPPVAPATVGDPFNLAGYTGRSQIKTHDGVTVLATLTVSVIDESQGTLRVFLPLVQAETLNPTPAVVPPRHSLPVWDVVISNADQSKVITVVRGDVSVQAGVTHWT